MKQLPDDYRERVYAGVLGKIIGVFLGRPFEGWPNKDIEEKLGEIRGYVHEQLGHELVVSDDDISGTFTFLRALEEHQCSRGITAGEIGKTWLNMIAEGRSILWWGGMGVSAEHTAYMRLKHGIPAPESGSIAHNGEIVAQQIGAQIFIDGWGLICPGEPDVAAEFARKAASVSHDGEAIYGAQVVAAMVAAAFEESDPIRLIEIGLEQVPGDCLIRQMADDLRDWALIDQDWRKTFARIQGKWGYAQWGGGCHMLPNHALILLALIYGKGSVDESLMIVNTAGWDTDCNSGNVGCILGVAKGLEGLSQGYDWRGPVADRMYLPTADSGRVVTDAARETEAVVAMASALRGMEYEAPKGGARFHFTLPGSVQGFRGQGGEAVSQEEGCLSVRFTGEGLVLTPTWLPAATRAAGGYATAGSPTLAPGQVISCEVSSESGAHLQAAIVVRLSSGALVGGESAVVAAGARTRLEWRFPPFLEGIAEEAGVKFSAQGGSTSDARIHWMDWSGTPSVSYHRFGEGNDWKDQWVNGASEFRRWAGDHSVLTNEGTGLVITGCREWSDYRFEAGATANFAEEFGVACCVHGMRRWIGLLACRDGILRLVEARDEARTVLAEAPLSVPAGKHVSFSLQSNGGKVIGVANGVQLQSDEARLANGAVALVVSDGMAEFDSIKVSPCAL